MGMGYLSLGFGGAVALEALDIKQRNLQHGKCPEY